MRTFIIAAALLTGFGAASWVTALRTGWCRGTGATAWARPAARPAI